MQVADGVIVVETRHNPALAIRTGKANISSKPYSAGGGGGQFPIFKNPNFLYSKILISYPRILVSDWKILIF